MGHYFIATFLNWSRSQTVCTAGSYYGLWLTRHLSYKFHILCYHLNPEPRHSFVLSRSRSLLHFCLLLRHIVLPFRRQRSRPSFSVSLLDRLSFSYIFPSSFVRSPAFLKLSLLHNCRSASSGGVFRSYKPSAEASTTCECPIRTLPPGTISEILALIRRT